MIGCLRTGVRKQPIIALYFESENEHKFYNLESLRMLMLRPSHCITLTKVLNLQTYSTVFVAISQSTHVWMFLLKFVNEGQCIYY